jgi:hypothetical protein
VVPTAFKKKASGFWRQTVKIMWEWTQIKYS